MYQCLSLKYNMNHFASIYMGYVYTDPETSV